MELRFEKRNSVRMTFTLVGCLLLSPGLVDSRQTKHANKGGNGALQEGLLKNADDQDKWTNSSSSVTPPPLYRIIATPEGMQRVHQLQSLVVADVKKNPDQYDARDVNDVTNGTEWHVSRYMKSANIDNKVNILPFKDSWEQMQTTLKWRQTMAINEDDPAGAWPCEFWLVGIIHVTVPRNKDPDQGGARLVAVVDFPKLEGYGGKLGSEWTRFLYWQLDTIDRWAGWSPWQMLVVFSGLHWSSIPSTEVISQLYPVVDHFTGKLNRLAGDRSGLARESTILAVSVDALSWASPSRMNNVIRWLRSDAELYGMIKKRDVPERVGGGRLPVSKSIFSEVYAALESKKSPLATCKRINQMGPSWASESELDKFMRNNDAIMAHNAKQINFQM